jgi:hypothetical protein
MENTVADVENLVKYKKMSFSLDKISQFVFEMPSG